MVVDGGGMIQGMNTEKETGSLWSFVLPREIHTLTQRSGFYMHQATSHL